MDASLEERMLRLAQELAISHGTFFAAALLADMDVPLSLALTVLAFPHSGPRWINREKEAAMHARHLPYNS